MASRPSREIRLAGMPGDALAAASRSRGAARLRKVSTMGPPKKVAPSAGRRPTSPTPSGGPTAKTGASGNRGTPMLLPPPANQLPLPPASPEPLRPRRSWQTRNERVQHWRRSSSSSSLRQAQYQHQPLQRRRLILKSLRLQTRPLTSKQRSRCSTLKSCSQSSTSAIARRISPWPISSLTSKPPWWPRGPSGSHPSCQQPQKRCR